jgi:hypothetical protein
MCVTVIDSPSEAMSILFINSFGLLFAIFIKFYCNITIGNKVRVRLKETFLETILILVNIDLDFA